MKLETGLTMDGLELVSPLPPGSSNNHFAQSDSSHEAPGMGGHGGISFVVIWSRLVTEKDMIEEQELDVCEE